MLRGVRTHPLRAVVLVVLLAGCGGYAWAQVKPFVTLPDGDVARTIPAAPELEAGPGEDLFRIDATRSSMDYSVREKLAGRERGEAVGTTQGIAGDIALNRGDPAASRIGEIVVDVRQLRSDNSLRDRRLRQDFLASDDNPLATFATTAIEGAPEEIPESGEVELRLVGDLTVRETTVETTWDATVELVGGELVATATTTVKMSDLGIGPISVAGLVRSEDDVTLTLDLVAGDPETVPTELPPLEDERAVGDGPSFQGEVQPILESSCASCHVTGRTLTDDDIATLADWAEAGAPLDVEADTPLEPVVDDDQPTPRDDLTLQMAEPYQGSPDNKDDYRCFTLDPGFTDPTFITGYSFVPDELQVVHHALVYKVNTEAAAQAREKDGEDGRPGWQCYVGTGLDADAALNGGLGGISNLVAGWVPGQVPLDFGNDAGYLVEPGEVLIAQIHYHYGHDGLPADQSELRLQTEPGTDDITQLITANPIAPVEIPCQEGDDDHPLCDRDAALAELNERYGGIAGAIPNAVLRACDREVEEYADQTDGIGSTSCDRTLEFGGEIVDVLGHMHEIGRSFRMTLNPGTDDEKVLLDIPTWNFDWQLNYQPVDEVRVEKGDVLRIECTWDRGLRHDEEPRYLLFAEGTQDEMCFSTYTLLPDEVIDTDDGS